ncbi:MAG: fimbria/pilus outer membrane usher protein [Proteobacteria bacterium]|nr:fimbria/pilus outer membrane usher protein [Pseudomonadota bacterium]
MRRGWRITLALWAAAASATGTAHGASPAAIEVRLNGQAPVVVLASEREGELYLSGSALRSLGLRPPTAPAAFVDGGEPFHRLKTLGLTLQRFDVREGRADIMAPAGVFPGSVQSLQLEPINITPGSPAAFVNYDFSVNSGGGTASGSGLFDIVGTWRYGSLTHSFVNRNLGGDDTQRRGTERLATTYRYDWINSATTLEAGDVTAQPGAFGLPLRFGGVSIYSNYGLRPGFVTQPMPRFSGEAVTPSTVDVFINDQLRRSLGVPAGPFTLNELPVVTGAGQARLVIRDALGREQRVDAAFYSTGRLLRQGLSQYAMSAGTLRKAFVTGDPEYGNSYLSALWRQGLSDTLTLEARAEMEAGVTRVAGAAATFALPAGEAEISGAVSETAGRMHWLGGAGYRYVSPQRSATLRWDQSDQGFRLAGVLDPALATQRQVTVTAGQQLRTGLSLNSGWIDQRAGNGQAQRSANLSLIWNLPRGTAVLLTAARTSFAERTSDSLRLTLSLPLDRNQFASVSSEGGSLRQNSISLQRPLPLSEGFGYRLSGNEGSTGTRAEASVFAQSRALLVSAEHSATQGQPGVSRFGARGSLGTVGGTVFAARSINDSFALVRVPDVADVPVRFNSQPAGRTDSAGRLVLPRVSALVPHRIEVDVDALPADVSVLDERASFVVAPRSAVIATLAVKRVSSALVRVLDPDGTVPPPGTAVRSANEVEASRVGPRGEIFVRARPGALRLQVERDGATCSVEFELPPSLPLGSYHEIGPLSCRPARP